jgi:hypothetical protein
MISGSTAVMMISSPHGVAGIVVAIPVRRKRAGTRARLKNKAATHLLSRCGRLKSLADLETADVFGKKIMKSRSRGMSGLPPRPVEFRA